MENDVVVGQIDDVDGNPHTDRVHPPARNDPEAPPLRKSGGRLSHKSNETRPVRFGNGEAGGKVLAARAVERVAGGNGHLDSQLQVSEAKLPSFKIFTTGGIGDHRETRKFHLPLLPSVLGAFL